MTVTLQLGSSERAVKEEPGVVHFGYRPALDGLRTVAVYLVVLFHAGVAQFEGGFIGVDLFFVLSGYLVTRVMLTEYDASGRIDLVRFYARRIRRLLPAAVLTIVVVAVTSLLVDTPLTRSGYLGAARSALLYFSNWHFIGDKTDYFAADADRNPYLHFWSLSVEEQFYAAFPLVLIALLFIVRGRRAMVAGLLGAITAALVGVQVFWWDRNPVRAYYGTDARTYQMTAGALLAVVFTVPAVRRATARLVVWVTGPLAAVMLAGLVVSSTDVVDVNASVRGFIAAGTATLLIAALEWSSGPVGWLLSRRTMVHLGRVSYGTYLWHWPIIVYAREVLDLGPVSLAVLATVGATAMAFLSSTLIEMPIRTTPYLANRSPQVVFNGLLVSAFVAVTLVPPIFNNDRLPVVTAARPDGLGVSAAAIATASGGDAAPATSEAAAATDTAGAAESSEPTESAPDSPTTEESSTEASSAGELRMTADMTFVTTAPDEGSAPSSEGGPEPTEVADDTQPESDSGSGAGGETAAFDDAGLPPMLSPEDTVPSDIDLAAAATYPIGMYECSESEPEDCILHEGSGLNVFVIGDSNASMLIPMFQELAEEHDFTLSATTAGGCTWQEGLGWVVEDQNRFEECLRIRDDAYERVLPALHPDIVIGIHIPRDDPARGDYSPFFPLDESNGAGFDGIVAATRTTLDDLEALGAQVIIIEPLPYTIADTVECLSGTRYVLECAFEATTEPIPMEELYRDEAAERDAVSSVDIDPIFCPAKPICSPIVDDELIFRDAFHVYPPYAVDHREQVWEVLEATGAFDS